MRKAEDWFIDGSALSTYRLKMDDCIIATFRVGLGRQWRGQIFPDDRVRYREPVHLLWWKEKWPEVRTYRFLSCGQWLSCLVGGLEKKKLEEHRQRGLGRGMCMKM